MTHASTIRLLSHGRGVQLRSACSWISSGFTRAHSPLLRWACRAEELFSFCFSIHEDQRVNHRGVSSVYTSNNAHWSSRCCSAKPSLSAISLVFILGRKEEKGKRKRRKVLSCFKCKSTAICNSLATFDYLNGLPSAHSSGCTGHLRCANIRAYSFPVKLYSASLCAMTSAQNKK